MGRNRLVNNDCVVIYGNANQQDTCIKWELKRSVLKIMKRKIRNRLNFSFNQKSDLEKILLILKKNEVNIISSGGTYKKIVSLGFNCTEVSRFTKFKEMLDGRVKTLHPKIHAGILSNRSNKKHQNQMNKK